MFQPRSNSVRVGQDSFRIVCKNGVEFGENDLIRFNIERQAGFLDMANSYLEMEVELTNPNNTTQNLLQPMLCLERDIGAQSLIQQLNIRSFDGGRIIEELRNYNTYAKVHYNATHTEGAMNRRTKLEGCAKSYMPQDNPYYTSNQIDIAVAAPGLANGLTNANQCWKPVRRKVLLPLLGGVFTNSTPYPALMLPTEVEILLEQSLRCLRVANKGDGQTSLACEDIPQGVGIAGDISRRQIFVSARAAFNSPGGTTVAGIIPDTTAPLDGEQNQNQLHNCWFRVGQQVFLTGAAAGWQGDGPRIIASIKVMDNAFGLQPGRLNITFTEDIVDNNAAGATGVSIDTVTPATGIPLAGHGQYGYRVYNPTLVMAKIVPPPQEVQMMSSLISKGQYSQSIISYTNIDNAIPAGQSTSTNMLQLDLTRVKSIISVPTSQSNTDNVTNSNALQGQFLHARNYQWQVDGKLQPDRRVPLTLEAFPTVVEPAADETLKPYRLGSFAQGMHRYEVEKTLNSSNIKLRNLHFITKNPSATNNTALNYNAREPGSWIIGRAFGAGAGTSQNLVNKSVVLYLDYNPLSTMVKLLKNFVVHVRNISIGLDGVSIYY